VAAPGKKITVAMIARVPFPLLVGAYKSGRLQDGSPGARSPIPALPISRHVIFPAKEWAASTTGICRSKIDPLDNVNGHFSNTNQRH